MNNKTDIEYESDVVQLVDTFYDKIINDETVGYIFREHMTLSLQDHLPIMYAFWQSILLDTMTYRGQVMAKHIELNRLTALRAKHFDKWLLLWKQTVNELYIGPKATAAITKAQTMAELMQYKIAKSNNDNFIS